MDQKSRTLSILLIIAIFLVIIISTVVKVYTNHQEKLILVTEKRIEEDARKCILDGNCMEGETIKLGTLIEHEYLESPIHPLTKEYLSSELGIECINLACNTDIN